MSAIYLDTVGLIALWDLADQWHAAADAAFAQLVLQKKSFVTTTVVLLECANAAARRPYRSHVCLLRRSLELRGELIVPTVEDWEGAWRAYERGDASQAGVVDHVSFIVMRRLAISDALTNDRHFRAAGFTTLF
jgi:predicted nucleic acid-binding protein